MTVRAIETRSQRGGGIDFVADSSAPDDLFRVWIQGETFPRVVIDPVNSQILTGNGTIAPAAVTVAGDLLAANNLSDVANAGTALANLAGQPLDTDLTNVAAVSTTAFGRALLALANAAALDTAAGLGTVATHAVTEFVLSTSNAVHLTGTATWDPVSLLSLVMDSKTVTVTGAVLGDVAIAGFSLALPPGVILGANVTAADTVTVSLLNATAGVLDVASGTIRADVFHL